ncbi:MAG TPA: DUF4157 domain-containing protein [Pyrinomonadaceae bacterium]|nr:DUF4157 domain-containing protein [Pyrinomonadaceae bacterium]
MLATASHKRVPKAEAAVESTTAAPPPRVATSRTSFPGPAAVRLRGGNGDSPTTIQIPRSTLPPLSPLRPRVPVAPQLRPVVPTFTVTNFPTPSGLGNARLTTDVNGLAVDSPVFSSSAEVSATGNVAGWRIGYIQTIFIHFLRDEYQHTNAEWNVHTPIRDALTTNTPAPWYSVSSNTSIFRGGPPTFAGMIDRPWHTTNWTDPRTGTPNSLLRSSRRLMLVAWLIARNEVSSQIIFLKHVRWEINFIINVDRSRPFANRAVNAGPGMSAPVVGEGQGTLAPTLSGTIYNDALNNASSRRLSPRAASPAFDRSPPSIRLNSNAGANYSSPPIGAVASGAGAPLPPAVQLRLGQQFSTDLGAVRVHSDARARQATRSLSARALTYGNHIFLGPGEQPTDLRLMAHETAHVMQQRGVPSLQGRTIASSNAHEAEAHRAADAVSRGDSFTVQQQTGSPRVQRLGLSDILDGLAELAANLPGFTLITLIIGRNPINLRRVERNFSNLLRAFMGLIPFGGELLFQVLNRYGIVERLGGWVSAQVSALGLSYQYLRERFTTFTDSLGLRDLFNPRGVWQRAENIFAEAISRVRSFVSRLVDQAIAWLKETFMQPLSNFCREIPGYTLVTVLLGRDPFTNAPVERSALNVVRAFAEFIPGGTEKVNQLVESRALQRAYEWFIQETTARNLTWSRVTGTFTAAWNSLRLEDVLHPIDTLQRMVTMFRPLMTDLVSFAGAALMKLLELIFEAAMGAGGARILAIFKRARETFFTIIRNPVGFLGNLLRAVGQGVRQFMTNILSHLRQGVISWLTGPVAQAGVQMPEQWDLRGIIWFVLQILGLTWTRVRGKLVRLLSERVVAGLETGFQLLQEIRERGLVQALRDRVTEFFGQLREAALGSIRNFIQQRLVMAGIQQLLSLLSPVGAVIQAIIKTYTTIQFFIQRINQILDLVESVVNSIAAIAAGSIGAAANFIERTMARTIPVILDFLARFIGLGDVGGHVQRTIQGLQARVDQMLDRAVEWIRTQAQRLASAVRGRGAGAAAGSDRVTQQFAMNGIQHTIEGVAENGRIRFYMSTRRELLDEKLARVANEWSQGGDEQTRAAAQRLTVRLAAIRQREAVLTQTYLTAPDAAQRHARATAGVNEISQALISIANEFGIAITDEETPGAAECRPLGLDLGRARGAYADPLTIESLRPPDTGRAQFAPGGFLSFPGRDKYAAGHLVADTFKGTTEPGNLALISRLTNGRFNSMESRIRNVLRPRRALQEPRVVLRYVVDCEHEPQGATLLGNWLQETYATRFPAGTDFSALGRMIFNMMAGQGWDATAIASQLHMQRNDYLDLRCNDRIQRKAAALYLPIAFTISVTVRAGQGVAIEGSNFRNHMGNSAYSAGSKDFVR